MQSLLFFLTTFALAAGFVSLAIRVLKKPPYFDAILFGCAITFFVSSTLVALLPAGIALLPAAMETRSDRSEEVSGPQVWKIIAPAVAAQIAIAEVKTREGWVGKADLPEREGLRYYAAVTRKPGGARDWRYIIIDAVSGEVVGYDVRN